MQSKSVSQIFGVFSQLRSYRDLGESSPALAMSLSYIKFEVKVEKLHENGLFSQSQRIKVVTIKAHMIRGRFYSNTSKCFTSNSEKYIKCMSISVKIEN